MEHPLVSAIEKAFDWSGPERLGKEFAYGTLAENDLCARLLTPTRLLDLVMRRSLAPHRLQCLVDGKFLHPHHYLTMASARRAAMGVPMADMQQIRRLLEDGCTVVVDEVNTYDPTIEVACRALQWWTHEIVQANTYLTTGRAAGFNMHWDDHDVIILQLAGEKSWQVRGLSRPAPMFRDAVPNPEPSKEIVWSGTMRAGDLMHIPRGYWHKATREAAGPGYSLHVTFGLTKRTGVDWLTWLADQGRLDELFRHDLDRRGTSDTSLAQERSLIDAAVHLIADRPLSDFLAARELQRPTGRHVATGGIFGNPESVVCVTDFPPQLEIDDTQAVVKAARMELAFAARAAPALRLLLSGKPVVVQELSATTGVNAAAVADALVDAGICAEVTSELASGYAGLVRT